MISENNLENIFHKVPSIIVNGTLPCTREESERVEALSHAQLMRTLDHFHDDRTPMVNAWCFFTRLAEDYALEQVGDLAIRRGYVDLRNRVAARYRELAESATDEVWRKEFLSAALWYEVK